MFDVILLLFSILEPMLFVNQHLSMFLRQMFRTIFLPACFLSVIVSMFFFCFGSCANYSCHYNCRFWKGRSVVVGRSPRGRSPRGRSIWMMVGHVSVSLYGPTRPPGACSRVRHQLVALLTVSCVWRALRAY